MTDHPIIFSAPMVVALLREIDRPGTGKTATRRLAWLSETDHKRMSFCCDDERRPPLSRPEKRTSIQFGGRYYLRPTPLRRVQPGDTLWVRERMGFDFVQMRPTYVAGGGPVLSAPSEFCGPCAVSQKSRPSIHMPRWASRITLEVTAVKVERLQDITEADARAEGVLYVPGHGDITYTELSADPGYSNYLNCRMGFEALWGRLHGPGAWDANPEVVAISFTPTLVSPK